MTLWQWGDDIIAYIVILFLANTILAQEPVSGGVCIMDDSVEESLTH